jgi:ribosome-associated protein
VLRVTRHLSIPLSELTWRFTTSGGPGGQHANRAHSRAEVVFDVARSPSLGPRQRSRLLARLGPSVRAGSSQERSQRRNRDRALERLSTKLGAALRVEPVRVATAPSAASRRRRLDDKKRRSATKGQRSRRGLLDD